MTLDKFLLKRAVPEIFSRRFMQPINQLMFRIAISGMGVNNYDGHNRDEDRFLKRLALSDDAVIFDVGANHGQFATLARQRFPSATIYSFEPNPASFAQLTKMAERLGIHAVAMGCGHKSGRFTMYDSSLDAASGLASFVPGVFDQSAAAIEATVTTIDEFCAERSIDRISLLKIDVEGFEAAVLAGAQRMLHTTDYVQFEFNEMNLQSKTNMGDFARLLPGFSLGRILYDGSLLPLDAAPPYRQNLFTYQNVVAVKRR